MGISLASVRVKYDFIRGQHANCSPSLCSFSAKLIQPFPPLRNIEKLSPVRDEILKSCAAHAREMTVNKRSFSFKYRAICRKSLTQRDGIETTSISRADKRPTEEARWKNWPILFAENREMRVADDNSRRLCANIPP